MLDPHLQERFARRCADAAFGYQAASTAAYAAFADQVLGFWSEVLNTPREQVPAWGWPPPAPAPKPAPADINPFAAWAFGWPALAQPAAPPTPALPANPWEAMFSFANAMTSAFAPPQTSSRGAPAALVNPMANPFLAWWSTVPFASPSPAWPMAFMLMSSGVPHSVAWPTAEANVAVMDAADAATQSIKQVIASYRTDGGHGVSAQVSPHESLLTFAALVPLNISTMLAAMRGG